MIHTDKLEDGWQFCDDYDENDSIRNYFIEGRFELNDLIAIWYNQFNIINLQVIVDHRGGQYAYITYWEGDQDKI